MRTVPDKLTVHHATTVFNEAIHIAYSCMILVQSVWRVQCLTNCGFACPRAARLGVHDAGYILTAF